MSVAAKLKAHGVLDLVMTIARRYHCDVASPTDDARAEMIEALRSRGWSEKNAALLLGPPPAPISRVRPVATELAPLAKIDAAEAERQRGRRRSRRQREVRARTISVKRLPLFKLEREARAYPEQPGIDYQRPKTRADCENGPRPCPFVSCKHHLYLDVAPSSGAIKINFPDIEPEHLQSSCALDVAELGGITIEKVAHLTNLTRERVRQIEAKAFDRMRRPLQARLHVEDLTGDEG